MRRRNRAILGLAVVVAVVTAIFLRCFDRNDSGQLETDYVAEQTSGAALDVRRSPPGAADSRIVATPPSAESMPTTDGGAPQIGDRATTIRGRVVDTMGWPQSDVRVGLARLDGESSRAVRKDHEAWFITAADGVFRFSPVRPGSKIVHCVGSDPHTIVGTSRVVTIEAGQEVDLGDVLIDDPSMEVMQLTVLEVDGATPAVDVVVNLQPYSGREHQNQSAVTDERGQVKFRCWPIGTACLFTATRRTTSLVERAAGRTSGRIVPLSMKSSFAPMLDRQGRFLIGPPPERIIFVSSPEWQETIILDETPDASPRRLCKLQILAPSFSPTPEQMTTLMISDVVGDTYTDFRAVEFPYEVQLAEGEYVLEVAVLEAAKTPASTNQGLPVRSVAAIWTDRLKIDSDRTLTPLLSRPWTIRTKIVNGSRPVRGAVATRSRANVEFHPESPPSGDDGVLVIQVPTTERQGHLRIRARGFREQPVSYDLDRAIRQDDGTYLLDIGAIPLEKSD